MLTAKSTRSAGGMKYPSMEVVITVIVIIISTIAIIYWLMREPSKPEVLGMVDFLA